MFNIRMWSLLIFNIVLSKVSMSFISVCMCGQQTFNVKTFSDDCHVGWKYMYITEGKGYQLILD